MRLYFKLREPADDPLLPTYLAIDTAREVYSYEITDESEHRFVDVNDSAMIILVNELKFWSYNYSVDLSAIDPAELEPIPF